MIKRRTNIDPCIKLIIIIIFFFLWCLNETQPNLNPRTH